MDDTETDNLRNDAQVWLERTLEEHLEADNVNQLTLQKCKQPLKDTLAGILWDALDFVSRQNDRLSDLENSVNVLKSELIDSQKSVINLQEQLLDSKSVQLQSLQQTVKTSVEDTVKAEFITLTYSAAAQKNISPGPAITPEIMKTVIKTAVREEDRSRNIMIFGLPEQKEETLNDSVAEVFEQLGVKPKMEACRVGRIAEGKVTRPIKVTLSSSSTVNQILFNARTLRNVQKYKTVFIAPDRSPDDHKN